MGQWFPVAEGLPDAEPPPGKNGRNGQRGQGPVGGIGSSVWPSWKTRVCVGMGGGRRGQGFWSDAEPGRSCVAPSHIFMRVLGPVSGRGHVATTPEFISGDSEKMSRYQNALNCILCFQMEITAWRTRYCMFIVYVQQKNIMTKGKTPLPPWPAADPLLTASTEAVVLTVPNWLNWF